MFRGRLDSFWNDGGTFTFLTDAPFDQNMPSTWPFSFVIKEPAVWHVNSNMAVGFIQDDWRVASNVRINMGLRYDIDTNFRDNAFHEALFNDPAFAGIGAFISPDRKMHKGDLQPRGGFTWDVRARRHPGRSRCAGPLRHPQPPVDPDDRRGSDGEFAGADRFAVAAALLSRHQRRPRRPVDR